MPTSRTARLERLERLLADRQHKCLIRVVAHLSGASVLEAEQVIRDTTRTLALADIDPAVGGVTTAEDEGEAWDAAVAEAMAGLAAIDCQAVCGATPVCYAGLLLNSTGVLGTPARDRES